LSAPTKYQARIVAREVINITGAGGKIIPVMRFTYVVENFPPRTVWVDKDKASKENVTKLVTADLSNLLGRKVEVEVSGL
jgi:hypothetical protein